VTGERWEDVRKAVPPDNEPTEYDQAPEHVQDMMLESASRDGGTGNRDPFNPGGHDEDRLGFEAILYAGLLDRGWKDEGLSDCTLRDTWTKGDMRMSALAAGAYEGIIDPDAGIVVGEREALEGAPGETPIQRILRRARGEL